MTQDENQIDRTKYKWLGCANSWSYLPSGTPNEYTVCISMGHSVVERKNSTSFYTNYCDICKICYSYDTSD